MGSSVWLAYMVGGEIDVHLVSRMIDGYHGMDEEGWLAFLLPVCMYLLVCALCLFVWIGRG